MDPVLKETASRIFDNQKNDADQLWATLEENGLTRIWVGEDDGGFGLTPEDGFGLIRLAGAFAAPVPFVETLVASWYLAEASLPVPSGKLSLFIKGFQRTLPFGATVEHFVCVDGRTVSLHRGHLQNEVESSDEDVFYDVSSLDEDPICAGDMSAQSGLAFAALARSVQICGALDAVLDLTILFAQQREQFGRALTKFQAIQHLISDMGAEAAAASAAVDAAAYGVEQGKRIDPVAVAVAKYRAGTAAGIVSENAHQIHGAIGYTQEYELARYSRRLWRWREDFGGESYWANELGQRALRQEGPLWHSLTKED